MATIMQENNRLKDLFRRMEPEPLPPGFNEKTMQQVLAEVSRKRKKEERLTLLGISLSSVAMIAMVIIVFDHFEISLFTFRIPALADIFLPLLTGLLTIILLSADFVLRRLWHRKHVGTDDIA